MRESLMQRAKKTLQNIEVRGEGTTTEKEGASAGKASVHTILEHLAKFHKYQAPADDFALSRVKRDHFYFT